VAKDITLLKVSFNMLFFAYCEISNIFNGPTHFLLVIARGLASFAQNEVVL